MAGGSNWRGRVQQPNRYRRIRYRAKSFHLNASKMVQPSFHSPQRPRFIWLRQCLYQLSFFAQLITAHKLSAINLMRNELIIYGDVDVKCFAERWKQSGVFISMISMRSCTWVGVWILNWNQFHLWSNRIFFENGWKSRTCNGQTMDQSLERHQLCIGRGELTEIQVEKHASVFPKCR